MKKSFFSLICIFLTFIFISCSSQNNNTGNVSVKFSQNISSRLSLINSAETVEGGKYEIKLSLTGDYEDSKTVSFDDLNEINGAVISIENIFANSHVNVEIDISYNSKIYYTGSEEVTVSVGDNPVEIKLKPAFIISDFMIEASYDSDTETVYKSKDSIPLKNEDITFKADLNTNTTGYSWTLNEKSLTSTGYTLAINLSENKNLLLEESNKLHCEFRDGPFTKSSDFEFDLGKADVSVSFEYGAAPLIIEASYDYEVTTSGKFIYKEDAIVTFTVKQNNKLITDGTNFSWSLNDSLLDYEEKASIAIATTDFDLTEINKIQCYVIDGDNAVSSSILISFTSENSAYVFWNHTEGNSSTKDMYLSFNAIDTRICDTSWNDFFFDNSNYDLYVYASGTVQKYKNLIDKYENEEYELPIEDSLDSGKMGIYNGIIAFSQPEYGALSVHLKSNNFDKVVYFNLSDGDYVNSVKKVCIDEKNIYVLFDKFSSIMASFAVVRKSIEDIIETDVEFIDYDAQIIINPEELGLADLILTNADMIYDDYDSEGFLNSEFKINDMQVMNDEIFLLFGLKGVVHAADGYNTVKYGWSRGGLICFSSNGQLKTTFGTNGILGFDKTISPLDYTTYNMTATSENKCLYYPTRFVAIKPDELIFVDDGAYKNPEDSNEFNRICRYYLSGALGIANISYTFTVGISCFFN